MKRSFLLTGTLVTISIIYFFTLFSWVSLQTLSQLLQRWGHQSEMTVYLKPEAEQLEINDLKDQISRYNDKIKISFQSQNDIRNSLKKLMKKNEVDFSNDEELVSIIPPHLIISGSSDLISNSLLNLFDFISTEIKTHPIVESTSYGKSWMDQYTQSLMSLKNSSFALLLILASSVMLAIGNTIRSHINSKREEIEILELVGATPFMIRKPYLIEGVFLSLTSMSIAIIITSIMTYFLKNKSFTILKFIDFSRQLHQLSAFECLLALLFSLLIGYIASLACLSEINTGWAASEKSKYG